MQLVPVKLYGLFGKFRPVEYEIDEERLKVINDNIEEHSIEKIGSELRQHMTAMKKN